MIALCLFIFCTTFLYAQHQQHAHERLTRFETHRLSLLTDRVSALEDAQSDHFDAKAFEDLRSKVEALRIAQGLRR